MFGYPVGHSLSPEMHNAALRSAALPYVYLAFEVKPENLAEAFRGACSLGLVGLNLTIPHKEAIVPLLDELRPEVRALGAVNTVSFDHGAARGYNTDVAGFLEPVRRSGIELSGADTVVFGAGGAARAVVYGLTAAGARVTLVNRTPERAEALRQAVSAVVGSCSVETAAAGSEKVRSAVRRAALLVNATSAGMDPHPEGMPDVPIDCLWPDTLVCDLIYRPAETRLLAAARRAGCAVMNGVPMLVHQGGEAFRIWFDSEPDLVAMEEAVMGVLSATGATSKLANRAVAARSVV